MRETTGLLNVSNFQMMLNAKSSSLIPDPTIVEMMNIWMYACLLYVKYGKYIYYIMLSCLEKTLILSYFSQSEEDDEVALYPGSRLRGQRWQRGESLVHIACACAKCNHLMVLLETIIDSHGPCAPLLSFVLLCLSAQCAKGIW